VLWVCVLIRFELDLKQLIGDRVNKKDTAVLKIEQIREDLHQPLAYRHMLGISKHLLESVQYLDSTVLVVENFPFHLQVLYYASHHVCDLTDGA